MFKSKILVIDDDIFFLDMLYELLFKKGYDVTRATSFEESVNILNRESFDLVFVDATLKNVPGTTAVRKVKELQKKTDCVVIMSLDDTSLAAEFMKDGAGDFVLKPFKAEELDIVIDRLSRRRHIEKDRDQLLYQNIEFIELLSLYRRIIRVATEWELDKIKDLMLDEVMESTFGQGALFFSAATSADDSFRCDVCKGVIDPELAKLEVPRQDLDNQDMSYFMNSRELIIPLRLEDRNYGFIKVVEPMLQNGFTEKEFNKAYHICEFMSRAIENARRFETLQKCTVKDERTHAYYWDIFRDFVKKEIYKALRYDRKLSILGVRVENLAHLRKNHQDDLVQGALNELGDIVNSVIRDSDWLVTRKEGEYLIFLTETDYFGAIMTIRRIRQALFGKCLIKGARSVDELVVNSCAVSLPIHGVTLDELLAHLEGRLDVGKNSIFHTLDFSKKNFDHLCDDILAMKSREYDKAKIFYSWDGPVSGDFRELLALTVGDVRLHPKRRGIIFAGLLDGKKMDFMESKDGFADIATKVYFFFKENKEGFDAPGIISVGVEKQDIDGMFIVYLNERFSYMYIEKKGSFFESCDAVLVESMISKLQMEYYLQWQL